jgi:hypothetical protein
VAGNQKIPNAPINEVVTLVNDLPDFKVFALDVKLAEKLPQPFVLLCQ